MKDKRDDTIPTPVWAVGFALEQTLHVVALPCSALRILKRLQHILRYSSHFKFRFLSERCHLLAMSLKSLLSLMSLTKTKTEI
jgi:hypothetical protein